MRCLSAPGPPELPEGGDRDPPRRELCLKLELRRPLGPKPVHSSRLTTCLPFASAEALHQLLDCLPPETGRAFPSWAASVPNALYSRNLRFLIAGGIELGNLAGIGWAGWQLYNNSRLLRKHAAPAVAFLHAR